MLTREKILESALELFNSKGYANVGVREIARILNISPGNLSYHFPKKEDILFGLLENFSSVNNQQYAWFAEVETTNLNFLILMEKIFHNQFKYRGVYIGNQFVQQELRDSEGYNYKQTAQRRTQAFHRIFKELAKNNQLDLAYKDVEFLVSYMTLFGRFWISEAFLLEKERDEDEAIAHYLRLLARQLSFFATTDGINSIKSFQEANEN